MKTQKAYLFEVKKNCEKNWQKWCQLLCTAYKNELLMSMKDEGIEQESFVVFEIQGKTYGIALLEGKFAPTIENWNVNKIHNEKIEKYLFEKSKPRVLYSITTTD